MTIAQFIQPGSKIDITVIAQHAKGDTGETKIYTSNVLDIRKNENISIAMPKENDKLVLLPLGVRIELLFYTKTGLYRAAGQVVERYKSANIYMLDVELKTRLEKFQRREFYRYQYLLDFNYYTISAEERNMESAEALYIYLRKAGVLKQRENEGSIVDLSGGGIRFRTDTELHEDDYVLFLIHLKNENLNKLYYIPGKIISCVPTDADNNKNYEIRAKFEIEDDKMREEIIRFIFEEERKARQRGRW